MPLPRVLHVIPSVSPLDGGPSHAIGVMERALTAAGVEVTTLTTDHGLVPRDMAGAPATTNGAHRIYARKWFTPYKVAPGLLSHLVRTVERHDVVHIHALFSFASTVAAWVARQRRVPYIVRPLGTLTRYGLRVRRPRLKRLSMALVEGPILRGAAAVHFTSQSELDEAAAAGTPLRGVVIPLSVDAEDGPAPPLQHATLDGRRVLLFLSRLDPKKNLEAVIDAVAASPTLRGSCALLIAGTGEVGYVASLKERAAAAGLSAQTLWLGHVDGAAKQAALAAADVFVLPSFSENFGIAAVEALRAGLPCVLGAGVAIARTVHAAGAGVAVPPETSAVAAALESIIGAGSERRSTMGPRARHLAATEFSADVMARRLIALYEDVRARTCRDAPGMPGTLAPARRSPEAP